MRATDRLYAVYDAVAERPALARPFGWALWGTDTELFYGALREVGAVPAGATVLDAPCGGGVAFRHLRPEAGVRYLAADLDPRMLERARAEARRRGVSGIEFLQADVTDLPLDDASVDFCLSSAGLHCFRDPGAAMAEIARCLRPGARLVATAAVRGAGRRQDALIALYRRLGIFGPGGTVEDLAGWARQAGLDDVHIRRSGAIARLDAVRGGPAHGAGGSRY